MIGLRQKKPLLVIIPYLQLYNLLSKSDIKVFGKQSRLEVMPLGLRLAVSSVLGSNIVLRLGLRKHVLQTLARRNLCCWEIYNIELTAALMSE